MQYICTALTAGLGGFALQRLSWTNHLVKRDALLACQESSCNIKHYASALLCVTSACAAGVDVQRDVLDLMGFKPLMSDVQEMDHRCFVK